MNVHYDSQKCSTNKIKEVLIIIKELLMQCAYIADCNDKREHFFTMLVIMICK